MSMVPLAVSIMGVITALFTLWDPMDLRHTLSGIQRVGFSVFVGTSDLVICYSCGVLVLYLTRFRSKYQTLAVLAATALAVAAPCTAIMYAGYSLFHGGRAPGDSIIELYAVNAMNLLWTAILIFYVIMLRIVRRDLLALREDTAPAQPEPHEEHVSRDTRITKADEEIPVAAAATRLRGKGEGDVAGRASPAVVDDAVRSRDTHRPDADAYSDDAVDGKNPRQRVHIRPVEAKRLLEGLPDTVGQDVVYMHVSGHYLEVVTTAGSVVVLMRLADAVDAFADRGMQVHRSYWVAHHHIRELVRRDHRMVLCLADGSEIPVSRPFLPAVRNFTATLPDSAAYKRVAGSE